MLTAAPKTAMAYEEGVAGFTFDKVSSTTSSDGSSISVYQPMKSLFPVLPMLVLPT
jgi:hypothetical protein